MTKRDFFRTIIKLFGLYWLINTVFSMSQIYNLSLGISQNNSSEIFYFIAVLIFIVFVFILLIFGADKIIKWLKLDKGYDNEQIDTKNIDAEKIMMLGMIIIGGLLIIDYIPELINQIFMALKKNVSFESEIMNYDGFSTFYLTTSLIKCVIGYLLLTNHASIGNYLVKKGQKKE